MERGGTCLRPLLGTGLAVPPTIHVQLRRDQIRDGSLVTETFDPFVIRRSVDQLPRKIRLNSRRSLSGRNIASQILRQELSESVIDLTEFVVHCRSEIRYFGAFGREIWKTIVTTYFTKRS